MIEALRRGEGVDDESFDRLYSAFVRRLSNVHWTPVSVATMAARWLVESPHTKVLDVGSGVGKFCQIGALVTPGRFVGIEQRRSFVEEGRRFCREHRIERARFVHGNLDAVDWDEFQGFYFFNPFQEHIDSSVRIDTTLQPSRAVYERYVQTVLTYLANRPVGTKVATFYGLGAPLPSEYELEDEEPTHGDYLRFWVKKRS